MVGSVIGRAVANRSTVLLTAQLDSLLELPGRSDPKLNLGC